MEAAAQRGAAQQHVGLRARGARHGNHRRSHSADRPVSALEQLTRAVTEIPAQLARFVAFARNNSARLASIKSWGKSLADRGVLFHRSSAGLTPSPAYDTILCHRKICLETSTVRGGKVAGSSYNTHQGVSKIFLQYPTTLNTSH